MKKVSYRDYCEECHKIQSEFGYDAGINFYDMGGSFSNPEINIGVNWAGCGTKSAEDTIKFAELLQKAAKAASEFKYNGYVIEY